MRALFYEVDDDAQREIGDKLRAQQTELMLRIDLIEGTSRDVTNSGLSRSTLFINGLSPSRGKRSTATRVRPDKVADLMEAMKIARRLHGEMSLDDSVDGAGYAGCAGEFSATENLRRQGG